MGTRVYIGRLPRDVREKDLYDFFREYKIQEVNLKNGYGFVEFYDERDAEDAVKDYDGKDLRGERVRVEHSRGGKERRGKYGPPHRTEYRVIVENVSSRASWQDLKDFMRKGGEVCYADIRDGRGIVEFQSERDMKKAVSRLDGEDFKGKRVRVKEDRKRSRSRSRSPRRRRSRSTSRRRSRRSPSRSRSRSKSRSKSRDRDRSRSKSRSPSRSPSRSRSRDKDRSRSRSGSPKDDRKSRDDKKEDKSERETKEQEKDEKDRGRSRSRSASRSRSRSRSGSREEKRDDADSKPSD